MNFSLRLPHRGTRTAGPPPQDLPDSYWTNTAGPSSDLVSIGTSATATPLTPAHEMHRAPTPSHTIAVGDWRIRL